MSKVGLCLDLKQIFDIFRHLVKKVAYCNTGNFCDFTKGNFCQFWDTVKTGQILDNYEIVLFTQTISGQILDR